MKDININVFNHNKLSRLPLTHTKVKYIIKYVLNREKCHLDEVSLNFISDREIRKINHNYLNHDYPTDILTFHYRPFHGVTEAEIYISPPTVRQNSKYFKVSFKNELMRVIIHGCLHLAGYKDQTLAEKELMREKENYYLGKLNFKN
ncbi:MAG: rRNA maturation RNase YbeY [Ignavibacteria bacterium]|nr:rRNA maturation RNase YbeY [Ignavibacteria bacterium]